MRYAVLGGGALGLMTAYRLIQAGHTVMVFEREDLPGGLAAGFQIDGTWLDKFYHHIFKTDTTMIGVIKEMGLGHLLEWSSPRTVSFIGGKNYQLDSPASLLRFQPLPFTERLRVGAVLAYLKLANPEWMEGKVADPWLEKWMGKRAYETIFQSLFIGKFGELYDQIALPWFWARIHDRTTQLGYVRGGFQLVYNALAERVRNQGGKLLLSTTVESVTQQDEGWQVATNRGNWTFERVISTLPTRLTCRLVPALPEDYRARYDWGQAYGAHCLILSIDRQLTDSYWINICDRGYPFTSFVEHTNYRSPEEYGGRHLVYLGNYRAMNDTLFKQSKEEAMEQFYPALKRLFPTFESEMVQESWMFQAPFAQPIVTTGYRAHIPPLETPLEGLWMANMFQVYPHDRGQNYSFELAEKLCERL